MSYGNCRNNQMPDVRSNGFCYRNDNGRVDYGTWGDPRYFDDFGPVVNSNVTNNNFIFADNMPPVQLPVPYPVQHHQMQGAPEVNFFNVNVPQQQQQQQPMQFSPVPGVNINVVYGQPRGEDAKPHSLEGFIKRMLDDAKCPCKLADRVKKARTPKEAEDIVINLSRNPKRFAKETAGLNIEDVKELIRSVIAEEKEEGVKGPVGRAVDKAAENKGGFFAKILGKDAPAVKTVEDPELRKRVAANEERIAKLEKAVAEEQEKNKKLAANDKRQDGIIAVQGAKIKEQTGKITGLSDEIAKQEKLGAYRQLELDKMKKKADLMEADLKKADSSSISALDAASKAAKSIEDLTKSLAGLDTKLTGIKTDTDRNTASIAGHATSLTASQSDIAKLTEAVKAVDKKVGIIAGMVAEQTGKTLPADVTKPTDVTTDADAKAKADADAKAKADADAKAKADADAKAKEAEAAKAKPADMSKLLNEASKVVPYPANLNDIYTRNLLLLRELKRLHRDLSTREEVDPLDGSKTPITEIFVMDEDLPLLNLAEEAAGKAKTTAAQISKQLPIGDFDVVVPVLEEMIKAQKAAITAADFTNKHKTLKAIFEDVLKDASLSDLVVDDKGSKFKDVSKEEKLQAVFDGQGDLVMRSNGLDRKASDFRSKFDGNLGGPAPVSGTNREIIKSLFTNAKKHGIASDGDLAEFLANFGGWPEEEMIDAWDKI